MFSKFVFALLLISLGPDNYLQAQAQAPVQPATGPGGRDERYTVRETTYGNGAAQYWIFEPDGFRGSAPVIAFLHGWGAMESKPYRGWIDHLVKRGNIVIYPKYQDNLREPAPNMTPNSVSALRDAFAKLGSRADQSKFAIVGHSLGGAIAFNVAAESASAGLPSPKALMAAAPGDTTSTQLGSRAKTILEKDKYGQIPRNTLVLVLIGDGDKVVGDATAKQLYAAIGHIPCENKNFVLVRSDRHGDPPLVADHFAPLASGDEDEGESAAPGGLRGRIRDRIRQRRGGGDTTRGAVDALDYFGYWKLFDALTDAAFNNRMKEYALGGTRAQTNMGTWGDGRPVTPLEVSNPGCSGR